MGEKILQSIAVLLTIFVIYLSWPLIQEHVRAQAIRNQAITAMAPASLPQTFTPQHEIVAFPANGTTKITWEAEPIARFEVSAINATTYNFIKLVSIEDDSQKIFVHVHPRATTETKVPLGEYELFMASGDIWYGEDLIFGNHGDYRKAIDTFHFYITENEHNVITHGHTLILKAAINGNVPSTPARMDDFK